MRIFRLPDIWSRFTPREWLEHMEPPTGGLHSSARADFSVLIRQLQDFRPIDTIETHPPRPVILPPGKAVGTHFHKQFTLIYFIDAEEIPIIVDGITIYPANNTAIMLDPDTPHEVPSNHMMRPRLSLALRFDYASK